MQQSDLSSFMISIGHYFVVPDNRVELRQKSASKYILSLTNHSPGSLVINKSAALVWLACAQERTVIGVAHEILRYFGDQSNNDMVDDIHQALARFEKAGFVEFVPRSKLNTDPSSNTNPQMNHAVQADIARKLEIEKLLGALRPLKTEHELIRLGPNGDGGYLVPNDLEGIRLCLSPGVGSLCGFEQSCIERGMFACLADASVDPPANIDNEKMIFYKKNVAGQSTDEDMTLNQMIDGAGINDKGDILLQMDIEGSEIDVLLAADDALLRRFRIMVIEFHTLHRLWNNDYFSTFKNLRRKNFKESSLCSYSSK